MPHTGRKRHLVFTHQAKAARPARTNSPQTTAPENLSAQLRAGSWPHCVNSRHTQLRVSGPPPHSPCEGAGISLRFLLGYAGVKPGLKESRSSFKSTARPDTGLRTGWTLAIHNRSCLPL